MVISRVLASYIESISQHPKNNKEEHAPELQKPINLEVGIEGGIEIGQGQCLSPNQKSVESNESNAIGIGLREQQEKETILSPDLNRKAVASKSANSSVLRYESPRGDNSDTRT